MSTFLLPIAQTICISIANSLFVGLVAYSILLAINRTVPFSRSIYKYHLSNIALLITFLAFIYPFYSVPANTVSVAAHKEVLSMEIHASDFSLPGNIPVIKKTSVYQFLIYLLNKWSGLVLFSYIVGLLFLLLKMGYSWQCSLKLKRNGLVPISEAWQSSFNKAKNKLGIRKNVAISFSENVIVPCIIGYSKAMVLIPVQLATSLNADQAEAILMHELGHFLHYDHYFNIAEQTIKIFLFFNPFAWLIAASCKKYREYAADEIVSEQEMQLPLAESLQLIAASGLRHHTLALSFNSNKNQLLNRIQNLLIMKKTQPRYLTALFAIAFSIITINLFAKKTDDSQHTLLTTISDRLLKEGNTNFIVVDAYRDGLIADGKPFKLEFITGEVSIEGKMQPQYQQGVFSINGKPLPEPYQKQYTSRMRMYMATQKKIGKSWSFFMNSKQLTIAYIIDPVPSTSSVAHKANAATDDYISLSQAGDSILLANLIADHFVVKGDDTLTIGLYYDYTVINNKKADPLTHKRYNQILKDYFSFGRPFGQGYSVKVAYNAAEINKHFQ